MVQEEIPCGMHSTKECIASYFRRFACARWHQLFLLHAWLCTMRMEIIRVSFPKPNPACEGFLLNVRERWLSISNPGTELQWWITVCSSDLLVHCVWNAKPFTPFTTQSNKAASTHCHINHTTVTEIFTPLHISQETKCLCAALTHETRYSTKLDSPKVEYHNHALCRLKPNSLHTTHQAEVINIY